MDCSSLENGEDIGYGVFSDDEISAVNGLPRHDPSDGEYSRTDDEGNNDENIGRGLFCNNKASQRLEVKEKLKYQKNERWERITDSSYSFSSSDDEDDQEHSKLDRCLFYHKSHKSEGEMNSLIGSLISLSTSPSTKLPSAFDRNAYRPRSNTLPTNSTPAVACPAVVRSEGNCLPLLPSYKETPETRKLRRRRKSPITLLPSLNSPWGSFSSLTNIFNSEKYTEEEMIMIDGDLPTPESELSPHINCIQNGTNHGATFQPLKCRSFHIVTTAALPWMTGTSINPTLRACYLNQMNRYAIETSSSFTQDLQSNNSKYSSPWECMGTVTLVLPWLIHHKDRQELYGTKLAFRSPSEQEVYIRSWIRDSAKLPLESDIQTHGIRILFYPARYSKELGSIFALGDICNLIPDSDADCCILEEPEHLNWMRPMDEGIPLWKEKFKFVVGIIHTNYKAYAKAHVSGFISAPFIGTLSSLMARVHCHRIIKLSSCLQSFAPEKEVVCNTHGTRSEFLIPADAKQRSKVEGAMISIHQMPNHIHFGNECTPCIHVISSELRTAENGIRHRIDENSVSIYFIGKLLWAKGLDKLLQLQYSYKRALGDFFKVHIYGSGPDEMEIKRAFCGSHDGEEKSSESEEKYAQESTFIREKILRSIDSFMSDLPSLRHDWKRSPIPCEFRGRVDHVELKGRHTIFVNPSITEVLCTTTAEALAMNNFVIIPHHPSNFFFEDFPNCLVYKNTVEFITQLQYAMSHQPCHLPQEWSNKLSWDAATSRLIAASIITRRDFCKSNRLGVTKADEKAANWLRSTLAGTKGDVIRTMIGGREVGEQYQYTLKGNEVERILLDEYAALTL